MTSSETTGPAPARGQVDAHRIIAFVAGGVAGAIDQTDTELYRLNLGSKSNPNWGDERVLQPVCTGGGTGPAPQGTHSSCSKSKAARTDRGVVRSVDPVGQQYSPLVRRIGRLRGVAAGVPVGVGSEAMRFEASRHEQSMVNRREQTHATDGTDLTLIRWMLSLSPVDRLEVLQASVGSLERLREVARTNS